MSEKKTRVVAEEPQSGRCAVIEIRRNEVFPESVVISYRDEKSLRELTPEAWIIGIGFTFREAAVAVIPDSPSTDADSMNILEEPAFRHKDDHCGPRSPRQNQLHRVGLAKTRGIAYATLQSALVAAVLMFYSRSVLGAVIRAFAGA
jgi:hypothetical protein